MLTSKPRWSTVIGGVERVAVRRNMANAQHPAGYLESKDGAEHLRQGKD
ncbi:MAG: hypothetical protein WCH07_11645 [Deltaproteobacteria bacterium]